MRSIAFRILSLSITFRKSSRHLAGGPLRLGRRRNNLSTQQLPDEGGPGVGRVSGQGEGEVRAGGGHGQLTEGAAPARLAQRSQGGSTRGHLI